MAFREHFQQALRGGAAMKYPLAARADAFLRKFLGIKLIRVPKLFEELPVYYKGNPASVVGTGAVVEWPAYSSLLDYELEVAVVIHRQGRDLSEAEVRDCIGGYLIFNDFSARDAQVREMDLRLGPAKGKDFDTGNSLGPWLVTPDEVGDLRLLRAQARVNGELWTDSSLSSLEFSVERILSYISQAETLYPGDVIGLGTVPNGCGMEHGRWLKDGDLVELSVDRLGTLSNRVRKRS
jgi:2-keto-4-pentenoate hydratase/2-oxohepta-3-ene-1,7-dioic acid hydratase in catechol pathway